MSAYNTYGYGTYPYGYNYNYGGMPYQNQQPQQNYNYQQPQPQPMQQQPQQPQTSYLPLSFVNGVIGAKAFIVMPNQTVFLKDSDEGSNLLFEKSADSNGKYTLKAYQLSEVKLDDIGKPITNIQPQQDLLTKKDLQSFATKNDLNDLKTIFEDRMNDLSSLIQKSNNKGKYNAQIKDGDKNE